MTTNNSVEEIKDKIAKQKGYPNWKELYDFTARENQLPSVVAQLIEGAMQDVLTEYSSILLKEKDREIEYYKQLAEAAEQLIISVEQYGEYNTKDFEKWQSLKQQKP